jgi:hypothetical protein
VPVLQITCCFTLSDKREMGKGDREKRKGEGAGKGGERRGEGGGRRGEGGEEGERSTCHQDYRQVAS